jgi:hypothetical protein
MRSHLADFGQGCTIFMYEEEFGLLLAVFFLLGLLPCSRTPRKSAEGGTPTVTAQMLNFPPLLHTPRIHFT